MDKQNVANQYDRVLFSYKKKRSTNIYYKMDDP